LSPDARWLLTVGTLESEGQYVVWDIQNRSAVFTSPADVTYRTVGVVYGEGGFLVWHTGEHRTTTLYRDDGTWITLWDGSTPLNPGGDRRTYFAINADGSTLFRAGIGDNESIFRHHPNTGGDTLLVEGAAPIDLAPSGIFDFDWW
jgi:hypothetical protein